MHYLSEDLNDPEVVSKGATRLTGYDLKNTGRRDRYVAFRNKNTTEMLIVVEPGKAKALSGMNEPFPNGLSVESKRGDGKLVANIFYEKGRGARPMKESQMQPVKVEVTVNAEG